MNDLTLLHSLYEAEREGAIEVPLPPILRELYGPLRFPPHSDRPYLIANFVTTLDGVTSLGISGKASGGPISGFNQHDRFIMGLLRSVADAVIVGAGTLRSVPDHVWTAEYIYPSLADIYQGLRATLGKAGPPMNVIVTARADIETEFRVFQSEEVPAVIVTTPTGARRLHDSRLAPSVQIITAGSGDSRLSARAILEAVEQLSQSEAVLVEGGPQLLGDFFAEECIDELFLTVAPQIAGRDGSVERPGLIAGKIFAPDHPLWGQLIGVKRAEDHLFLRYSFSTRE